VLRETVGDARLRELRAEGAATDRDHDVLIALDAIARAHANHLIGDVPVTLVTDAAETDAD
jgi:hypothetical protein